MTKVYLDSSILKSNTCPKIEDAIYKLNKAYEKAKYLKIPNDFRYYRYANNLKYNIDNYRKICESINTWIDNSIDSYEKNREKLIDECKKIENTVIDDRMNIVK